MRIKQFVRSRASDIFTFDEIQRALPDVSPDHIRTQLRKLRDAGVIESPGRGRKEWRRLSREL
jgi:DNA-binding transcriptional ArsR family regulator